MSGVILTDGGTKPRGDGHCEQCGEDKGQFKPVMGGQEVCMKCGYQRDLL